MNELPLRPSRRVEAYLSSPEYSATKTALPQDETRDLVKDYFRKGGIGMLRDEAGKVILQKAPVVPPTRDFEDCADFALSLGGETVTPFITTAVWNNPTDALGESGFEIVHDTPLPGDVLAYRVMQDGAPEQVRHFGLLQTENAVLSKFGKRESEIYLHDITAVLPDYGDVVFYYRKKK